MTRTRAAGGTVAMLAGLALLALLAWNLVGPTSSAAQQEAGDALTVRWQHPATAGPVTTGMPAFRLRIPRLDVDAVVLEGADPDQLDAGPGHYPGTAQPGDVGTVGIAGHRVTHGAPFYRLDELSGCDLLEVDTASTTWTYKVLPTPGSPDCGLPAKPAGRQIVTPDRGDVLNTVHGRALLVLTTCHPRFSAAQRLIVRAQLVGSTPRT